jgi:SAM-dependent methyltransferase
MSVESLRPFWSGLFKEKRFFSYHRCSECGLLYTPIFFTADQLRALYAHMAPNMDVLSNDAIAATQRGYFNHVSAAADFGGAYLEIGPDVGHLAALAAASGKFEHFWLFEPNLAIHDRLRRSVGDRPSTLIPEMEDLSSVPEGSIGLAVMVHVLDHLVEPQAMLAQIRSKLRPGGTLMIVTHNERSLLRSVMGRRWPPFCLQHPELYNPETIRRLLRHAGYDEVDVKRSRNHFPIDFLARQAAWTVGLKLPSLGHTSTAEGLRLGTIITMAKPTAQAASR